VNFIRVSAIKNGNAKSLTPPVSAWWFQTYFIFPFHIWDNPNPIDELHHFSGWLLHHQPGLMVPNM